MIDLKTSIRVSAGLGWLSLAAWFASNLALMDISHGESDVTLEWRIVHISYALFGLFHLSALVTFIGLLKLPGWPISTGHGKGVRGTDG